MNEVGRTRDVGWEIGVSRIVDSPVGAVWDFITSPAGIAIWLGVGATLQGDYETATGTHGETRSFRPLDRLRLTWWPADWSHDTTLQLTVRPAGDGRTRLGIHQERLTGADERERQRQHWRTVMTAIADALT